jgi:hypothetical protein
MTRSETERPCSAVPRATSGTCISFSPTLRTGLGDHTDLPNGGHDTNDRGARTSDPWMGGWGR